MLLYADDFVLLSCGDRAVFRMRQLLGVVDEFNLASGMHADTGLGKTEMIIFGVSAPLRLSLQVQVFCIGGAVIRYVAEYKYLGIVHH